MFSWGVRQLLDQPCPYGGSAPPGPGLNGPKVKSVAVPGVKLTDSEVERRRRAEQMSSRMQFLDSK